MTWHDAARKRNGDGRPLLILEPLPLVLGTLLLALCRRYSFARMATSTRTATIRTRNAARTAATRSRTTTVVPEPLLIEFRNVSRSTASCSSYVASPPSAVCEMPAATAHRACRQFVSTRRQQNGRSNFSWPSPETPRQTFFAGDPNAAALANMRARSIPQTPT